MHSKLTAVGAGAQGSPQSVSEYIRSSSPTSSSPPRTRARSSQGIALPALDQASGTIHRTASLLEIESTSKRGGHKKPTGSQGRLPTEFGRGPSGSPTGAGGRHEAKLSRASCSYRRWMSTRDTALKNGADVRVSTAALEESGRKRVKDHAGVDSGLPDSHLPKSKLLAGLVVDHANKIMAAQKGAGIYGSTLWDRHPELVRGPGKQELEKRKGWGILRKDDTMPKTLKEDATTDELCANVAPHPACTFAHERPDPMLRVESEFCARCRQAGAVLRGRAAAVPGGRRAAALRGEPQRRPVGAARPGADTRHPDRREERHFNRLQWRLQQEPGGTS
eukprot:COSAG04_NODE_3434_length_2818_cov_1.322177_2_plen_335_part_00